MTAIFSPVTRLLALIVSLSLVVGVTFAADPTVGEINPATSITGETEGDRIGMAGVHILPSGNMVIASSQWGGNKGAVTCLTPTEYRTGGITVNATNSLTGDSTGDFVGSRVWVLTTGDYVVASPLWDNGGQTDIGAVTWVNGDTCIPYGESSRATTVKPTNSMIGSTTNDQVGFLLYPLPNGNYVISSKNWSNGATTMAGAITWCRGILPCVGVVSPSNSLVGSNVNDRVGTAGIRILSDGNYVVQSPSWNNSRGAATWCHQNSGCVGEVSALNSLIGSMAASQVSYFVFPLPNGNYVVESNDWRDATDTKLGAITWCSNTGCKGTISASNSLIGSTLDDSGVTLSLRTSILANGNYIVRSPEWDNSGLVDVGAVTWCSGASGCTGVISATNSVVGSTTNERLGNRFFLGSTGTYIISNQSWDNGATANVGALRLCSGISACNGPITVENSLIGGTTDDQIGNSVAILPNGNFVVGSPLWDNPTGGIINAGAATFITGNSGLIGTVTAANSLIGEQFNDQVGNTVTALTNGHYVVNSPSWNNGATLRVGASTWGNGQTGLTGVVSPTNSLIGSHTDDGVGAITMPQSNGNYLTLSSNWNNVGAVTWCDGTHGCIGEVSAENSLVGSNAQDFNPTSSFGSLPNGNFPVTFSRWDNGSTTDAGAMVIFSGLGETVGVLSASNAIVGSTTNDITTHSFVVLLNSDMILNLANWDNGPITNAGAIIRISGTGSTTGEINITNALVGSATNELANVKITSNPDSSFFIAIPNWNDNRGVIIYSAGPENLLKNPSFETAGSPAKYAAQWKSNIAGYTAGDKRLCDKPAKPITRTSGSCVFQFNSANTPLKSRTAKQVITNPVWGTAGNILTLTADVEGLKVGSGAKKILLNIKYDNNTTVKATLTIPTGTYDYTTLLGTVKLTRPVKTVTVTINVGKAKGRIRVDNLFLSAAPAPVLRFPSMGENTTRDGASTFEMPAAPDGFRN